MTVACAKFRHRRQDSYTGLEKARAFVRGWLSSGTPLLEVAAEGIIRCGHSEQITSDKRNAYMDRVLKEGSFEKLCDLLREGLDKESQDEISRELSRRYKAQLPGTINRTCHFFCSRLNLDRERVFTLAYRYIERHDSAGRQIPDTEARMIWDMKHGVYDVLQSGNVTSGVAREILQGIVNTPLHEYGPVIQRRHAETYESV